MTPQSGGQLTPTTSLTSPSTASGFMTKAWWPWLAPAEMRRLTATCWQQPSALSPGVRPQCCKPPWMNPIHPCSPHPQNPVGPHRHAPWPAEGALQGTGVDPDLALQAHAAGMLISQCLVTSGRLQLLRLLYLSLCMTVFRICIAYLPSWSDEILQLW